jgi:hypothetical protein
MDRIRLADIVFTVDPCMLNILCFLGQFKVKPIDFYHEDHHILALHLW